ncbi:hypothetical protein [Labilibacter marinus]|uniref:hypothetical protein n=1 Tax=Labilibacter marinus TaxID=1477105 RepID=UPI00117A0BA6|nr:hypothetical protein [Labilibacter marinus]
MFSEKFKLISEKRNSNIVLVAKKMRDIHSTYLEKINKDVDLEKFDSLLQIHQDYLYNIQEFNGVSYLIDGHVNSKKELGLFFEERNKLFSKLAVYTLGVETKINRQAKKSNPLHIRFNKTLKRVRYGYLKLFNRKDRNVIIKRWVPLKYYLLIEMYLDVFPLIWKFHKQLIHHEIEFLNYLKIASTQINNLYKVTEVKSIDELKKAINEVIEKCNYCENLLIDFNRKKDKDINSVIISKREHIDADFGILGTLEKKHWKYSQWYTSREIKSVSKQQIEQLSSLEVSLYSISEDWCFDADLCMLKNNSLIALQSRVLINNLNRINTIREKLIVKTNRIVQEYERVNKRFNKFLTDKESIHKYSQQISDIFASEELFISKVNHSQTILYAINEIEQSVKVKVDATNDKRMISSGKLDWEKMQLSNLNSVFLKDLIKFEIIPQFTSSINNLKQLVSQKVAMYESELSNLVHISEYNFETITSILNNNEADKKLENASAIIEEGKEKILFKLNEIAESLNELQNKVYNSLYCSIENLTNDLIALTENEKVGELNLRLLKAKAISKSTKVKDRFIVLASKLFQKSLVQWQRIQKQGFKYSKHLVNIYSQEEVQASINNEISVFLSEIASTTDKLPFLYQRLFKLEPVEGGYLYFKRSAEINNLKQAYNNWLKGRFANIAITAEKGAGTTSIINYVLKDSQLPFTCVNFQEFNNIYRQDEFIFTLSEIMDLTPLNEVELFIDELNNTKGIIVLEGLQYAYLKKVDGFETLKLLFEIISKTNKNIFWICTCTLHAWNYLNKAISIEEYFGHVIRLGEFSNVEMVDIVKKRHQVSGYSLVYLKSKEDVLNKKLSKLNQEEVQNYLEKQYFEVLNSIAKGNITIAFIFWLRSIKRIEKNTLYINSMSDFNISFIRELKQDKLFCLYAILLHDGLDLDGFCKVMRFSPEQGRMKLFQMVDDGLLLEISKRYVINLLLYRSTIDALKAKNILH